jgi:ribonuclease-3
VLGYAFTDQALLRQALTHRSFGQPHNERLEFIGDSVLNCVIAEALYRRHPSLPEGELSRLRSSLVNQTSLAARGRALDVGARLMLGEGEVRSGGAQRASMLADAVEALIGGVFLDGGFDRAREVVLSLFEQAIDEAAGFANARPRAMTIAAICAVIGRHQLLLNDAWQKRLIELHQNLRDPW